MSDEPSGRVISRIFRRVCCEPARPPGARLSHEDTELNYRYRHGDRWQDAEILLQMVCAGRKPFATFLMEDGERTILYKDAMQAVASRLGLGFLAFFLRGGRRRGAFFQPALTLAAFYDPDETIRLYAAHGVELPPDVFRVPLQHLARGVLLEDFPASVRLPLLGLCLGHPVRETVDAILAMRLRDRDPLLPEGGQHVLLGHPE